LIPLTPAKAGVQDANADLMIVSGFPLSRE